VTFSLIAETGYLGATAGRGLWEATGTVHRPFVARVCAASLPPLPVLRSPANARYLFSTYTAARLHTDSAAGGLIIEPPNEYLYPSRLYGRVEVRVTRVVR